VWALVTHCHVDLPGHLLSHLVAALLRHHLALLLGDLLAGLLVSVHTVVQNRLYTHLPGSCLTLNTRRGVAVFLRHQLTLCVLHSVTSLLGHLVAMLHWNSLTLPGETFVPILGVFAGLNKLSLTLQLLCSVAALPLDFVALPLLHSPACLLLHLLAVLVIDGVALLALLGGAPGNSGVSWYPSSQNIYEPAEYFLRVLCIRTIIQYFTI